MAFIELGDRAAVERAVRLLFLLPFVVICPLLVGGMLKDHVPIFLGFVLGGAIGGGIGYLLSEGALKLLQLIWPPKTE